MLTGAQSARCEVRWEVEQRKRDRGRPIQVPRAVQAIQARRTFKNISPQAIERGFLQGVYSKGFNPISIGPWRSLVAHLNGVQVVGGSNPLGPTR